MIKEYEMSHQETAKRKSAVELRQKEGASDQLDGKIEPKTDDHLLFFHIKCLYTG